MLYLWNKSRKMFYSSEDFKKISQIFILLIISKTLNVLLSLLIFFGFKDINHQQLKINKISKKFGLYLKKGLITLVKKGRFGIVHQKLQLIVNKFKMEFIYPMLFFK